jgi:hypothetical protein
MDMLGLSNNMLEYSTLCDDCVVEAIAIVIPNACARDFEGNGNSNSIVSMAISLIIHMCNPLPSCNTDPLRWGYTIKISAVFGSNLLEEDAGRQYVCKEYTEPRTTLNFNLDF